MIRLELSIVFRLLLLLTTGWGDDLEVRATADDRSKAQSSQTEDLTIDSGLSPGSLLVKRDAEASIHEKTSYYITAYTSNDFFAGTNDKLYISIEGEYGHSGKTRLWEDDAHLEKGSISHERLDINYLGKIKSITVTLEAVGDMGDDWKLNKIEVAQGVSKYVFDCDCVFDFEKNILEFWKKPPPITYRLWPAVDAYGGHAVVSASNFVISTASNCWYLCDREVVKQTGRCKACDGPKGQPGFCCRGDGKESGWGCTKVMLHDIKEAGNIKDNHHQCVHALEVNEQAAHDDGLSNAAVAGIVIPITIVLGLVVILIVWCNWYNWFNRRPNRSDSTQPPRTNRNIAESKF